MKKLLLSLFIVPALFLNSCAYKHFAETPEPVSIENLDVDQSLVISEAIMHRKDKEGNTNAQVLGYWAMRAQPITAPQAKEIARVYTEMIDTVAQQKEFFLWHYTWAITDYYRLGDSGVQAELEEVYHDAIKRGKAIDREKFVDGEKLLLGYFHFGGWAAAKNYLVAPGNRRFNQSDSLFFEENPQYQP